MSSSAANAALTYLLAGLAGVAAWLELPSHGGDRGFGSLVGR
jgi:hypothetical protein